MVTLGLLPRIVVVVDGSTASRNAVLWAAEEARFGRLSLIVTQLAPTSAGVGPEASWWAARDRLSAVAAAASTREPGIAVGTQVLTGDVGDELIRLTRTAVVLVVGGDFGPPRAARGMIGAIEDRVVVHAECPIVVISHQPVRTAAVRGHVVVGWTESGRQASVLHAAVVEANARGIALTIVADGQDARPSFGDGTPGGGDRSLLAAVGTIARTHPRLKVTIQSSSPDLARELQRQSTDADLLVLGCDQSADLWSIDIAQLTASITRRAQCPVMLVGPLVGRSDIPFLPSRMTANSG